LDPGVAEQAEELAAAAADVEHGRGVSKVVDVGPLALTDVGGRAAHPGLEAEVVRHCGSGGLGGDGRWRATRAAPLDAEEPLLELAERPHRVLARALAAVDLLEDPGDHLQHYVVEHPLL